MIPTAKEFLAQKKDERPNRDYTSLIMKEFAEIHVKEALKEAAEKVFYTTERDSYRKIISVSINKESIINAYPVENIK